MKHLVVGEGNLGMALCRELERIGDEWVCLRPKERGANEMFWNAVRKARYIWVCVGGRHREARLDPDRARRINDDLTATVLDRVPEGRGVVFFSTADLANPEYPTDPLRRNTDEPRTHFARCKAALEGVVRSTNRPRTAVVRLSTLFGPDRPEATFPGRILSADWPADGIFSIPWNEVTPTPAAWAAEALLKAENLFSDSGSTFHHLAPRGSIGAHHWAKIIFGEEKPPLHQTSRISWDLKRPKHQRLECSLDVPVPHWSDLWYAHFFREQYMPGV